MKTRKIGHFTPGMMIMLALLIQNGSLCLGQETSKPEPEHGTEEKPSQPPTTVEAVPVARPATTAPQPQDDNEGRQLLRESARAIREIRAITYRTSYEAFGLLRDAMPPMSAEVRGLRTGDMPNNVSWLSRVTGTRQPKRAGQPPDEFDAAWRPGGTIEWVDKPNKKVYERRAKGGNQGNTGSMRMPATTSRFDEFFSLSPFAREIAMPDVTLEEPQMVGQVECQVVLARNANGSIGSRIYIGSEDRLPRKVEKLTSGSVSMVHEIKELVTRTTETGPPVVSEADLRVPIPDDFVEDRQLDTPKPPPPTFTPEVTKPVDDSAAGKMKTDGTYEAKSGMTDSSGEVGNHASGLDPAESPAGQPNGLASHSATTTAAPITPPAPAGPTMAPGFELTAANGEKITTESLRGTIFVLDFFGTWCIHAPEWHAKLDETAKSYSPRGVRFFTCNVREKLPEKAVEHMTKGGYSFPMLTGPRTESVARAFGVRIFPAAAVVSATGEVLKVLNAPKDTGELERILEKAITGKEPESTEDQQDAETDHGDTKSNEHGNQANGDATKDEVNQQD